MTGVLEYHSYLGILAFVDQSEEFRLGRLSQTERQKADTEAFRSACNDYRTRLLGREPAAATVRGEAASCNASQDRVRLFEPYSCLAFGHTDSVIITLSDLFDSLFILSQTSEISFEQLSLAFCPRIDCLGLPHDVTRWLEEPHEFVEAGSAGTSSPMPIAATPLLLVTRLKLGGIAKLVNGRDITFAVLRAIGRKLSKTIDGLLAATDEETRSCFPSIERWRDSPDDVPFRCTMFDSQGVAELTLVMRSNNFALPTVILHHLRSLTIADLYAEDASLEGQQRELPSAVEAHIRAALGISSPRNHAATFTANHVFATSYSTACVDSSAFDPGERHLEGVVSVDVNWAVSPGHLGQAITLQDKLRRGTTYESRDLEKFYHVRFGKFDLEYRLGSSSIPVMGIGRFLDEASEICELVKKEGGREGETGLLDMTCIVSVPIPKLLSDQQVGESHFPLARLHSVISQGGGRRLLGDRPTLSEKYRWFSRKTLILNLQKVGVPKRLRDSVAYLFSNFFHCLNDPKLFDSILDLCDAFRATYSLLASAAAAGAKMTPESLREIEAHVAALEDACYYRLCLTSPQHELNDMAVHFRGGLNQLLAGADVFLKVGVGVVKWLGENGAEDGLRKFSGKAKMGAITELCFAMQPRCVVSTFAKHNGYGLAHLKLNVGHVFHINEAVYYMHEVGHLLQSLMNAEVEPYEEMCRLYRRQLIAGGYTGAHRRKLKETFARCAQVWVREIFAEAFVFCFVCGLDEDLFLRQHLAGCSSQPERYPQATVQVKSAAMQERLLVAFFATSLDGQWRACANEKDWLAHVAKKVDAFESRARHLVAYHVYAEEVLSDDQAVEVFWREFRAAVKNACIPIANALEPLVMRIRQHFLEYYRQLLRLEASAEASLEQRIGERIADFDRKTAQHLSKGRPITPATAAELGLPNERQLDHVLLTCCSMIRSYLRTTLGAQDDPSALAQLSLHARRGSDGDVIWPPKAQAAPFMLDQGFAGFLCARQENRAASVRWAAAVHKTLQDLSAELRLRRLLVMLNPCDA